MGSQLLCVDCNFEGATTPDGDCPRCGSEWTTDNTDSKRTHTYSYMMSDRLPRGPIATVGCATYV